MLVQVLHLVLVAIENFPLVAASVHEPQKRRALEARVAHAIDARAVDVLARAVDLLEIESAHTQTLDVPGHLAGSLHGDTPTRQAHVMGVHVFRPRRVFAPRKLNTRLALRVVHQVVTRADLHDVAILHHSDAVAEAKRLVDVVAHVQDGAVECVEQADEVLLEHALQVRVKRGERLVEHEDPRTRRKHARQSDTLLLTAG